VPVGILAEITFKQTAKKIPHAILAIAGRGELENQLKATARRLDVAGRIFFLGFRHDIPRVMRSFGRLDAHSS
jgi:glycosyltransferase involved in cell wall biosynthesis